ncbi:MAG: DUF2806 domain-containing protein [Alphaproteobacteria bacterium]|nr:DUF2806 domain-containing protein [Alphaproteobacteria bacterium]
MAQRELKSGNAGLEGVLETLHVELGVESTGELSTLARRVRQRLDRQEARRQINLESIVRQAMERLAGAGVATDRIDPDWLSRFAAAASEVESEPMQVLWSRVLAQQILRPGAISLRTISVLSNLTPEQVDLFARLARFVINNFVMRLDESFFESKGIAPDDLLVFEELGLLRPGTGQMKIFKSQSEETYITHLLYRDQVLRVSHNTNMKPLNLPCYRLTSAGAELAEILPIQEDSDYIVSMTAWLSRRGYRVAQARINARSDRNTVASHTPFCELVTYDQRFRLKRAYR